MNSKTLTALKRCIMRWEKIAAGETYSAGADTCALCGLFNNDDTDDTDDNTRCNGCPVANKTGMTLCRGTPYLAFVASAGERATRWVGAPVWATNAAAEKAARAEVRFLKSLLPAQPKRRKVKVKKRTRG